MIFATGQIYRETGSAQENEQTLDWNGVSSGVNASRGSTFFLCWYVGLQGNDIAYCIWCSCFYISCALYYKNVSFVIKTIVARNNVVMILIFRSVQLEY